MSEFGGPWNVVPQPWLFVVVLLLGGGSLLDRTLGSADEDSVRFDRVIAIKGR